MVCGGAAAATAAMCLLALVSLLGARSSDAAVERAASFAVSLIAVALGLAALWSATNGPAAMGGPIAQAASAATRVLASFGIPVALFQIQAAISAVIVGFLAWRFPHRQ
jgi:hypothetical protein